MDYEIIIPADKEQAEKVYKYLVTTGKQKRNPQACRWWISYWYMRGARKFTTVDYANGSVSVGYYNEAGRLQFRYEEILTKYQTQYGRLLGMDVSPVVTPLGLGLDGLRKASTAQIVLNAQFGRAKSDAVKSAVIPPILVYGTCGLALWQKDQTDLGIEVVMPWELLPVPVECTSVDKLRGIIRRRLVPLDWVKKLDGVPGPGAGVWSDINASEMPSGDISDEIAGGVNQDYSFYSSVSGSSSGAKGVGKEDGMRKPVVEFGEVWLKTESGYLAEYLRFANGYLLSRDNYEGERRLMPVTWLADMNPSGVWGRSFVETLMPLSNEIEYALTRMFQNLIDWDLYGIVTIPSSLGVHNSVLRRGADGIKRIIYEPDYTAQTNLRPENIPLNTSGDMPVRALQMALDVFERQAHQPSELMSGSAPGRVDSAQALGLLNEYSSIPLSPTAHIIAAAFIDMYKAMLQMIGASWDDSQVISVTHLDDSIAGIKFDPQTGELHLASNTIPHPDEVQIAVASQIPRSKEQMKMELREALSAGIITPMEFRIMVRKEGLSLPVGNEAEWQNYRRAMLENIILFADGITPGKVLVSDLDMHPVHLMVLQQFMAKPEFYLASTAVMNAFRDHYNAHLEGQGKLPEQLPYIEQAAEQVMGQPAMGPAGIMG